MEGKCGGANFGKIRLSVNAKDEEIIQEQARKNPEDLGFNPGVINSQYT